MQSARKYGKIFNNKSKPKTKEGKDKKRNTFDNVNALHKGRELILNAFKSLIFPIKATKSKSFRYNYVTQNIKF